MRSLIQTVYPVDNRRRDRSSGWPWAGPEITVMKSIHRKAWESEAKLEERQVDLDSSRGIDVSPQNASSILSEKGLDEVQ
jgi:hypothetical protein